MREPERDHLLWELPRSEEQDDRPAPVDGDLRAYRAGTLPSKEATRLEWHLAGSRRGRERLAELAGIVLDASPARRPPARGVSWGLAGLALAATLGLAALLVLDRRTPALPLYDVRVHGLADARAGEGSARSLAEGMVRVEVEPRGDSRAGLHFHAYRLEGSALLRLREPQEIRTTADRGSAELTAQASRLVGRAAGTRPFFVVVSGREKLPDRLATLAVEDAAETLRRASGGRVHRVLLTIIEPGEDVR